MGRLEEGKGGERRGEEVALERESRIGERWWRQEGGVGQRTVGALYEGGQARRGATLSGGRITRR